MKTVKEADGRGVLFAKKSSWRNKAICISMVICSMTLYSDLMVKTFATIITKNYTKGWYMIYCKQSGIPV